MILALWKNIQRILLTDPPTPHLKYCMTSPAAGKKNTASEIKCVPTSDTHNMINSFISSQGIMWGMRSSIADRAYEKKEAFLWNGHTKDFFETKLKKRKNGIA